MISMRTYSPTEGNKGQHILRGGKDLHIASIWSNESSLLWFCSKWCTLSHFTIWSHQFFLLVPCRVQYVWCVQVLLLRTKPAVSLCHITHSLCCWSTASLCYSSGSSARTQLLHTETRGAMNGSRENESLVLYGRLQVKGKGVNILPKCS